MPPFEQAAPLTRFYQQYLRSWMGSLVLLPACLYFAFTWGEYTILDNADLIIHEAGHFFFRPFGRFMTIAGGTLMQIILPSILVWHFWQHAYRFGVQVSMFWLGHNLINISVYAADARSRVLPLLGGGGAHRHDWWNMLRMTGLLEYDQVISTMFFSGALLIFVLLLALPYFMWE